MLLIFMEYSSTRDLILLMQHANQYSLPRPCGLVWIGLVFKYSMLLTFQLVDFAYNCNILSKLNSSC